jgi:hypothetical protein
VRIVLLHLALSLHCTQHGSCSAAPHHTSPSAAAALIVSALRPKNITHCVPLSCASRVRSACAGPATAHVALAVLGGTSPAVQCQLQCQLLLACYYTLQIPMYDYPSNASAAWLECPAATKTVGCSIRVLSASHTRSTCVLSAHTYRLCLACSACIKPAAPGMLLRRKAQRLPG